MQANYGMHTTVQERMYSNDNMHTRMHNIMIRCLLIFFKIHVES